MVGVGGRSGGCHTCRRRRVKCDETHPTCQRCAKAKVACEGYTRDMKFVDEKDKAQKRVQIKRQAYLENIQAEKERNKANRHARIEQGIGTISVDRQLPMYGFKDQIQTSYTLSKLFMGFKMFIPFATIAYRGTEDDTTTQTVKALSSVWFGRIHHHQASLDTGMGYYSKALRLLGRDLVDSKETYRLPTLTNVLSLCLFEMMAANSGALIQHQGGIQKLIAFRTPERFQTQPELSVLEACRLCMFHGYMEHKKRCFLEEPKWRTIPWIKHPEAKTLLSLLYDQMVQLPGILEDMEALRTKKRSSPADVLSITQNVYAQLRELFSWRAAWEAEYPSCAFEVPVTDPSVPFSTALHYTNLLRAIELALYNTAYFLLYRVGRILMGPDFNPTTASTSIAITRTNPSLILPGDQRTVYEIAMEILRSVPYAMLEPHQNGGSFQFIFPMRVVVEVIREGSKEWNYLKRIFAEIADNAGFVMARRMMPAGICGRMLMDEGINSYGHYLATPHATPEYVVPMMRAGSQ